MLNLKAKMRGFSITHYTAIVSTLAFLATGLGGLYFTKHTYDLSAAKDERELKEKTPTVDVQIRPNQNASSADVTISILNRGDVYIAPQDITVLPSLEFGEFYFSSAKQSLDSVKSSLSLLPMGIIAPKAGGTMKAKVSGVTDGKDDSFTPGVELQFVVRIRLGDDQDAMRTSEIVRHVKR